MVNKPAELVSFADWSWRLLIGLALLLIAFGLQKRQGRRVETTRNGVVPTKSWPAMDLRWEPAGQHGQGIYANGGPEARFSAAEVVSEEGGAESLVEPRLAVFTARPLDLNRIDFDTLRVLQGVGPKMAAAIIAYRQNHGPFRRLEDLLEVKGVGPVKFKELSRRLAVKSVG